jgi:hypothetical protein
MDVQVVVLKIERQPDAFALNRRTQRGVDVEGARVAELLTL